jgi:hypothetical protein
MSDSFASPAQPALVFQRDRIATSQHSHRSHSCLNDLIIAFQAMAISSAFVAGRGHPFSEESVGSFGSLMFSVDLLFPLNGPLEMAMQGQVPQSISLALRAQVPNKLPNEVLGTKTVQERIAAAIFCAFCDPWIEWQRKTTGGSYAQWPKTANFVRVVRNALTHGNRINVNDIHAVRAGWYHLSYGHAENGNQVLHKDISIADLVFLMVEFDECLTFQSAPLVMI